MATVTPAACRLSPATGSLSRRGARAAGAGDHDTGVIVTVTAAHSESGSDSTKARTLARDRDRHRPGTRNHWATVTGRPRRAEPSIVTAGRRVAEAATGLQDTLIVTLLRLIGWTCQRERASFKLSGGGSFSWRAARPALASRRIVWRCLNIFGQPFWQKIIITAFQIILVIITWFREYWKVFEMFYFYWGVIEKERE